MQEAQEKRSLLPHGTTVRVAVWQHLRPMPPDECDRLYLWQIGGILGHHLVEKSPSDPEVLAAQTTLKKRAPVIESFMEKRNARKAGKKRGKKR